MADTSRLGTILIVAVICVGALLLVSAAIPAWQEYQRAAGPGGDLPGLPSAGTVGKDPVSPSGPSSPSSGISGKDPVSPLDPSSPSSGISGKDPVSPSSGTVGKDPSSPSDPVSPSAGPAAPSAPAAGDPILGTWSGTKSVTLFFVSANGNAVATFRDDYSGEISGEVHGAGMDEVFSGGFVWQNNGGGRYTGVVGENSVDFTLQGDTLSMVVNPKKLGVNDLLDLDIPVEMHRV
ncbi:MAG TPA: hypothetical protein O0X90_00105 [Methanocorpusculum sp.]|nr:hypothetical protein [Methanocorpusculum sp.]